MKTIQIQAVQLQALQPVAARTEKLQQPWNMIEDSAVELSTKFRERFLKQPTNNNFLDNQAAK